MAQIRSELAAKRVAPRLGREVEGRLRQIVGEHGKAHITWSGKFYRVFTPEGYAVMVESGKKRGAANQALREEIAAQPLQAELV